MERYQVKIAYDGTHFQGFQRQGSEHRTVQGEVEAALRRINWQGRTILSAGRTDTGVHASGQVIAFDLDWPHSTEALANALNAYLPEDVAVKGVRVAAADFHPRFDALARCYHYHIYCQPARDPLRERFAWRVWSEPDGVLLNQAAEVLVGTHDFAAFGAPMKPGGSTIRTVLQAGWEQEEGGWIFKVTANAFLYHMVRRMVFLQVLVGQQKCSLLSLTAALQNLEPQTPGLAKPSGLNLTKVFYYEDRQIEPEGLIQTLSSIGEDDCG